MDPLDVGTFLMPMAQTVSFSLLFDRTYETWSYKAGDERSRLGVLSDIKAFYAMLGILGNATSAQGAVTGAGKAATAGALDYSAALTNAVDVSLVEDPSPRSFMQYVQVVVMFGRNMTYHGVINNAVVNYTHFTRDMIPNRCSLQVSMTLFPWSPEGSAPVDTPAGRTSVLPKPSSASKPLNNDFNNIRAGRYVR